MSKNKAELITLEYLHSVLEYRPDDSKFPLVWKHRENTPSFTVGGKRAGCEVDLGYIHITLKGKICKLHRLVYMMKHNIENLSLLPKAIDHIDRNKANNLMENLRDGSVIGNSGINSRNRDSLGQSKYRGVSLSDKLRSKFNASISINLQETVLLYYKEEEYCAQICRAACKYMGYEYETDYPNVADIELPKTVIERIEKAKMAGVKEIKYSNYAGVTWSREKQKYVARIHTYLGNGKAKNLSVGYYNDDYEAAVRRDLYIIEHSLSNDLQVITKELYQEYRVRFPKEQKKKLEVAYKDGSVKIFGGMTEASNELHIDKKNLSAYLQGKIENKYADRFEFRWVYVDKQNN